MNRLLQHTILIFILSSGVHAQDIHFSQFYASPLTLNPALTGFSAGDMRINLNYRNQNQGYIPYTTYSGSIDLKLIPRDIAPDIMAVGVVITSDDAVKGYMKNTIGAVSLAYHKSIGYYSKHFISFGAQAGTIQRSIMPNEFSFPNQWSNNEGYVSTLPNQENLKDQETAWLFDLNLGLMWFSQLGDETSLYAGSSIFHVNKPVEALGGYGDELPVRTVVHGGIRFPLSSEMSMTPNAIWTTQNQNKQLAAGSSFEYKIGETDHTFRLGAWYRLSENALIFSAGLQIHAIQIGVSSDFYSPVHQQARSFGAFEIALVYTPAFKSSTNLPADPSKRF